MESPCGALLGLSLRSRVYPHRRLIGSERLELRLELIECGWMDHEASRRCGVTVDATSAGDSFFADDLIQDDIDAHRRGESSSPVPGGPVPEAEVEHHINTADDDGDPQLVQHMKQTIPEHIVKVGRGLPTKSRMYQSSAERRMPLVSLSS